MIRRYKIPLQTRGYAETVRIPQYDTGYLIVFDVTDLPEGTETLDDYTAVVEGVRSDGLKYSFDCTISGTTVSFEIDTTCTGFAGRGEARIRFLYASSGEEYASKKFLMDIEKSSVPDGAVDAEVSAAQEAAAVVTGIINSARSDLQQTVDTELSSVRNSLSDIDGRVMELEANVTTTFLGNTPITLADDADVKLVAQEQTTYSIPEFLADYNSPTTDDVEVRLTNTTITREGGKMIFTATGDNINQCFADLRLNTLTVGETYTLVVTRGEYVSGTTGGYFIIYDRDGEELGRTGDITQDEVTLEFTATTTFARVRLQPTTNYYYETYGIRTTTIVGAAVYSKRSGTFNAQIRLGVLPSGTLIESDPSCEVYSITQKEEITVDDALSTNSRNPVQNRRIATAIGELTNLRTIAKNNLVAAINEAANSSGTRLAGKTCVFLGDSVAAFRNPPEDIPSIVGLQTGMTVYNCAFGGCRISDNTIAEGSDDPWEAFCFARLADGIATGDWSYQEANIDKLQELDYTGYSPSDHFTTLKGVNWSNVDYCVVFFAGNDPGAVRFDDPNNSENTFYYLGAFRYSIKKMLTAYPHLKFLVVGTDYHKTGGSNTDERTYTIDGQVYHYYDWSDRLMAECKNFHIPTLDWYRSNGLNALTVDYYMTSDGKHPNLIGNQLLGGQIATKMLSQY